MGFNYIFDWFSGDGRYMTLIHCMGHDYPWIVLTVMLDIAVAAGYGAIAMHWWKNERMLPPIPAKRALRHMRNIFLFCGLCGYAFIPVKMFWPAWRLYDLFMCFLVYFTWRYAWGARELKVVYNELGRTNQLAEDLKQSRQESAEKTFFLNAICHDLRTPLSGMILHADLAKHGVEKRDDATIESALAEVKSSAQIASSLLDTLLDYAHVGSGQVNENTTFDLADFTRAAADRSRLRAQEKGLTLSTKIPDRVQVHLDRNKLERALTNLIDNAIKFTERGSVRVEAETSGAGLEIHVIDTGCGIAAEHQPSLFREFFQIDNAQRDRRKGFGLGLAISRRLARQMGGEIVVESADGQGSRFSIVLPNAIASGNGDGQMIAGTAAAAPVLAK